MLGFLLTQPLNSSFAAVNSSIGSHGEMLKVSKSVGIKSGDSLVITGQHFDETIGIYVALCKVVSKGELPTPCGGGADKSGSLGAADWISSNPPSYGVGLAKPYLPGGRFSFSLKVSPVIALPDGKSLDCRKIKCAIYTRADHTRGSDRSYDLLIPLNFKK